MRLISKTALLVFVIWTNQYCTAGKIEKGFQALQDYNYFKAKELFEKSIKKYVSPASYGLATIYYRKDNPFHSIDSAYKYILDSEKSYSLLKEKKKEKLKVFAFDYLNILELRSKISSALYLNAEAINSEKSYSDFIGANPWSNELFVATYKRDSIAYSYAKNNNTSAAYQTFLTKYPDSEFHSLALEDFYRTQFQEYTKSNSLAVYLEFMLKSPDNPYVYKAEDRIFEIATSDNEIQSYILFIQTYPKNRNVGDAWRKVYQLYMLNFSEDRIDQFKLDFPNYPYWEELEEDLKYIKLKLLPFKADNYYGFMDYNGNVVVKAEYEQLGFFKEGLALAMKNGRIGFIDKGNRLVINFLYDEASEFDQGRSIVAKNELFGMIDRSGEIIFPIEFTDIGQLSEGLIYAQKDSLYGYYDNNYNLRIPHKFSEAYAFKNDVAKVQFGDNQAFIDEFGTFVVPPGFESIAPFSDTLMIFEEDGLLGLMKLNCEIFIPAQFDEIGQLANGRALVLMEDMIGYLDESGKLVIKPQFETFPNDTKRGQFNMNHAVVRYKGKFGIIDKQGKFVLPASFTSIGDYSGLIAYSKGKGWGFMDPSGKIVIQPQYDYAESFVNGLAIVEKLTLQGVIDTKGQIIIPLSYTSVNKFSDELFLVSNGSKYGLYSDKGEFLVPIYYQQIRFVDKDLILLSNQNEVHYLYLPERKLIKPVQIGE